MACSGRVLCNFAQPPDSGSHQRRTLHIGTRVEIASDDGKILSGTVVEKHRAEWRIEYDGYDSASGEWFSQRFLTSCIVEDTINNNEINQTVSGGSMENTPSQPDMPHSGLTQPMAELHINCENGISNSRVLRSSTRHLANGHGFNATPATNNNPEECENVTTLSGNVAAEVEHSGLSQQMSDLNINSESPNLPACTPTTRNANFGDMLFQRGQWVSGAWHDERTRRGPSETIQTRDPQSSIEHRNREGRTRSSAQCGKPGCSRPVTRSSGGVQCVSCSSWQHFICAGLSCTQAQELTQVDGGGYRCGACASTSLTQDMSNLQIDEDTCSDEEIRGKFMEAFGHHMEESVYTASDEVQTSWLEVCKFSNSLYKIPSGRIGKMFIDTLCNELQAVAEGQRDSERLMTFAKLILIQDHNVKKAKDVKLLIEKRLDEWRGEKIKVLLTGAERCSKRRNKHRSPISEANERARIFSRLMLKGNTRAAVRFITDRTAGGVMKPNDIDNKTGKPVFEVLKSKHPNAGDLKRAALVEGEYPEQEQIIVTSGHVEKACRSLRGSAGPSGTDAEFWQDALLRFGASSEKLRILVATLTSKMCNQVLPLASIRAILACRLIALDKCPGVRPIGIGETLRRLMCKLAVNLTRSDVENLVGVDQLAAGVESGIEGAIHAMSEMFEDTKDSGFGLLLMDAQNAFNSLNRKAALLNIRKLWPRCSTFIFNTYRGWSPLILQGAQEILYSMEGTTQGDPLAMLFYGISLIPLINLLKERGSCKQCWYADDGGALGSLAELKLWMEALIQLGPMFGYFPEPAKSVIVVDGAHISAAKHIFESTGVQVSTGHRYLGSFIGSEEDRQQYLRKQVKNFADSVGKLAEAAETYPHEALAALTRSLQAEWTFVCRVYGNMEQYLKPIEEALARDFIPKLIGHQVSEVEETVYSLSARNGGLGIRKVTKFCNDMFETSKNGSITVTNSISRGDAFDPDRHRQILRDERKRHSQLVNQKDHAVIMQLKNEMDSTSYRSLQRANDFKTSSWLTARPSQRDNFNLNKTEFRDAIAIRYCKPISNLPSTCDGCGDVFTLQHALSCKKGGLVSLRHNEIRDAVGDIASLLWANVHREPVIREPVNEETALVADLLVRGVWSPQRDASFDIRVTDTDSISYRTRTPQAILASAEREKKQKYHRACEDRHICFTPLVTGVDGALAPEFDQFLRRVSFGLSLKWERCYSDILNWVRTRISYSVLRATSVCIRGTRTKWRRLGVEDGASFSREM